MRSAIFLASLTMAVSACGDRTSAPGGLAGTWDFLLTPLSPRSPTSGTLTWDRTSATLQFKSASGHVDTYVLILNGAVGTVTGTSSSGSGGSINIEHTGGGGSNAGSVPLDPYGTWVFRDSKGSGTCTAVLSGGSFTATGSENFRAERIAQKSSIFGELGGDWTFTYSGSKTCAAHLTDGTFSATCGNSMVTVAVNGDMLSGSTSDGYEISGQRR